ILASGRFDRFAARFGQTLEEAERVGVRTASWGQLGGVVPSTVGGILAVIPYFLAVGRLNTVDDVGEAITYVALLGQTLPILMQFTSATSELALAAPS